ncbi:hypothetical protein RB2654_15370 [Rhodobacterales bacterium HTCC2654]|uniref:Uncharacterized protein n=1 Tax=Maritimibacter alkaliphilus HTCC2654 TaxID=314271 RepID=A3VHC3_9RHOB|nr:hypothetical protein RB2654_15370 [Rhodobacterales bacterium HTCC2654] [Maritimibacter alkaliphilus HTCC2654]
MQRLASSWNGAGNAFVGQTSRQAVQRPQFSRPGRSGSNSAVVKIAPRKNQLPKSRLSRLVCLPCHPSPAACASGFSITGAVSTNTLISVSGPAASISQRPTRLSRFLTMSW